MPASTHEAYHVYHLPRHLLDALTPQTVRSRLQTTETTNEAEKTKAEPNHRERDSTTAATTNDARACNVCLGATFADVDSQRAHFRSDWHRYNVKLRMNGGQPVDEARFAQLIEGLEDSLSGSASSSSEEGSGDSDGDDAVSALISRTKRNLRASDSLDDDDGSGTPKHASSPLVWFHAPPSTQLGLYKALFSLADGDQDYLRAVRAAQTGHGERGRTWALFMVAGGHFAGAIVRVSRSDEEVEAERAEEEERAREAAEPAVEEEKKRKKAPKQRKMRAETEVLKHKTFHRYTTRRKQGGSQSVNDNAKHKAKSAGAQLRRYGEQALREDIQGLLKEWEEDIADCERIWIRASWSNRRMFLDENGGLIEKGDERLRAFPFPTRRPTQTELIRCLAELLRVKVTHFTEEELRAQDEAYLASLPKPKPKPASTAAPSTSDSAAPTKPTAAPALSAEQQLLRATWTRAQDMVVRGRADALKALVDKGALGPGGADARVPSFADDTGSNAGRTLLMLAASAAQPDLVRWLLEEASADPTVDVPSSGGPEAVAAENDEVGDEEENIEAEAKSLPGARRTAYDLARSKEVRDVFRRAAGAFPDRWDWLNAARVPSALTREMEEERGEKKKARRKGLKDKIREREAREATKASDSPAPEPEPEPAPAVKTTKERTGPQKLGGASGGGEGTMGLTPEMRAKVERERRARAAEARLKALGGH